MTLPPYITQAADTFEAHQRRSDVMKEIDWFHEHNDFQSLRQIQEYLNEKMPRKDAA